MIVKTLRTLSGNVKIQIPENLNEITLGQMIAMEQFTEDSTFHPLIPQLTKEIADNIIDISQSQGIRERCLSIVHKIKYCYNESAIPKSIVFGTKKVRHFGFVFEKENRVDVIKNLSIEPAGAYLSSRDLIADEINRHINLYGEDEWKENFVPSLDVCAGLLANYFYCRVTGELFSEQKAEAFKSEVLKLSIQDALPIARSFFLQYPNLFKQRISLWQALRQIWKKKQVSRRLKSSATSTR